MEQTGLEPDTLTAPVWANRQLTPRHDSSPCESDAIPLAVRHCPLSINPRVAMLTLPIMFIQQFSHPYRKDSKKQPFNSAHWPTSIGNN